MYLGHHRAHDEDGRPTAVLTEIRPVVARLPREPHPVVRQSDGYRQSLQSALDAAHA